MSLPQPSQSFAWTQEPCGPVLRCAPLSAVAAHLFTSAAVSVSREPENPALAAVAACLDLTADAVVQVHQVHGCNVTWVRDECEGFPPARPDTGLAKSEIRPELISADAIVSGDPRHALGVRVADCAPILMADLAGRAVAAVHAGWRGTAAGIVDAAARALTERFGVEPRDLLVAIGPCIHQCCYEVGPELREEFAAHGHDTAQVHRWFSKGRGDRWQLDVTGSNRDQLEFLGVPPDQIIDSGLCTACHPEVFHSYRRSGSRAGRMLGVIRAKTKSL